jgi:hypothetical protein
MVVPPEIRERWTLTLGDSIEVLPSVEGSPDIFYHDSDHSYRVMMMEFEWALQNVAKFIAADDIGLTRAWGDFVTRNSLDYEEVRGFGISMANRGKRDTMSSSSH